MELDKKTGQYKPVYDEHNFSFQEYLNEIAREGELEGRHDPGWLTFEEREQEAKDREITDLILRNTGVSWNLDVEEIINRDEFAQRKVHSDNELAGEEGIELESEQVRLQRAKNEYDRRRVDILDRILVENLTRVEAVQSLEKQKPKAEVSPDFVDNRREVRLVGSVVERPVTRRKRKLKQRPRLSPDRNDRWESSAGISTFDINYADTSHVAEFGIKKRKRKPPSKSLTSKSINENIRRLTAESRVRDRVVDNLQREVRRLTSLTEKLTRRIGN